MADRHRVYIERSKSRKGDDHDDADRNGPRPDGRRPSLEEDELIGNVGKERRGHEDRGGWII